MQPDYDELDDLDEGGFNWMLVMVLLLAVGGFFSLAWYAYETGSQQATSGEVVVITADKTPVRERPKEAGGREFPHQEKTIYEAMNPNGSGEIEVQLREQEETPRLEEPSVSADQKVAQIIQQAVKETSPKPKAAPKLEPAEISKPEPEPAEPATSGERVQLGAFRSRAEAEKQWNKIVRSNSSLLKGKPHQVVRADLGSKGVFYRLRVAGFSDVDAAKKLCKSLSARGQGCFLVR